MTASFLHYISLFLSVFFVTNKMRLPCRSSFFGKEFQAAIAVMAMDSLIKIFKLLRQGA
jgi:hypothetical protein